MQARHAGARNPLLYKRRYYTKDQDTECDLVLGRLAHHPSSVPRQTSALPTQIAHTLCTCSIGTHARVAARHWAQREGVIAKTRGRSLTCGLADLWEGMVIFTWRCDPVECDIPDRGRCPEGPLDEALMRLAACRDLSIYARSRSISPRRPRTPLGRLCLSGSSVRTRQGTLIYNL